MKTLLAFAAAVIVAYVALTEWLDRRDVDPFWQADAHTDDGLVNRPHPWSETGAG